MRAPATGGDRRVSDSGPSHLPVAAAGERRPAIEALDRLADALEGTRRALDVFVDEVREHGRT